MFKTKKINFILFLQFLAKYDILIPEGEYK